MGGIRPMRHDPRWLTARAQLRAMPGSDICWRCGERIPMDVPHNDPMQWTADHVQSLQNGGNPFDVNNLRPAHRSCNSKRGTETKMKRATRIW
jgi:5-methylcytosine-specific restriction endonuclease McrA